MNALEIDALSKSYGSRIGIQNVSLSIPQGMIFGFLGPNGAGKTTTIRILMGLLRASKGTGRILGRDCWKSGREVKNSVGYLPGDLRLYSWLTARRAADMISHFRRKDLRAEARRLTESFELDSDVKVKNMSRGMRQKLGLVLALTHKPEVLILDEPTASLDPLMQSRLHAELRLRSAEGATVFFSSHTLDEVERLCRRVAIVRDGRIVADDTLEGLRSRARRVVTLHWQQRAPQRSEGLERLVDVYERGPLEWRGVLTGPAMELVQWSAAQPLADISIDEPDLSALFQEFYR